MTPNGPDGLPYRRLLGLPGVPAQAVLGFLAQLTQQVAPVGIVLVVQGASGSLALAGVAAAAFSVGAGMGRPVQGRLMDRHGARTVLAGTAFLHVAALLALLACARPGLPWWPMVVPAWIAGLGLPPVSVSMRVEWGRRVAAPDRTAAYSLVYLVQELAMLAGPLLFGLLIAVASASLALGLVAGAAGAGTLAFARALLAGADGPARERGRAFADRRMLVLMAVVLLHGGTFGALQVGLPALAAARGVPAATGLLVAALSLGGIAGAIAYGARSWRSPAQVRLVGLMLLLGLALAPLVPAGPLPVFCVVLFAGGLVLNPALTTSSLLVDEYAPTAQAEAFGWISTGLGIGGAAGSAVAGVVGERFGHGAPFLAGTAFALAGGALAALLLRRA
ncbi:putative MFS family arabinose efflux permease [Nonomuraea thailandensis]|uniref:MFS family arabinose efflux permease n=1 Tax=Nonomuraea thailandensis TaxID=1188745 RepID=A0A9X2K8V1_9ACTN|nr:MFS transporter [Nonomuraea thailandensis]MCP2363954.1 putative MFS family arabinose efflux permease [Nonomuraea thailandensis]